MRQGGVQATGMKFDTGAVGGVNPKDEEKKVAMNNPMANLINNLGNLLNGSMAIDKGSSISGAHVQ